MEMIPILFKEFEQEAQITKNFLERVPIDKLDWQPHPKSMKMRSLASHIAELLNWVNLALTTDGIDFAARPYKPITIENTKDLMRIFEDSYRNGSRALHETAEEDLEGMWTIRKGDQIILKMTKFETVRHTLKHVAHHRAQLGVYFRLLDIPLPSTYGPSADEQKF